MTCLCRNKTLKKFKRVVVCQKGISALVSFMVMTLLSIIALSVTFMTMTDTRMAAEKLKSTQALYLAESGAEYGLKRLNSLMTLNEGQNVSMHGGVFSVDTSSSMGFTLLTAQSQFNGINRTVQLSLQNMMNLGSLAMFSTGTVTNITSLDEDGNPDPSLMVANADSMPPIDYLGLIDLAISQSHVEYSPTFTPDDGYPNGSFYASAGVPNVTHVTGDLDISGGRTVYGIFIVEGDVKMHGSARLDGVIYLPNFDSEVEQITFAGGGDPSGSTVSGGIIANGDISGSGNHITVQYNPEYMGRFGDFERPSQTFWVAKWEEL